MKYGWESEEQNSCFVERIFPLPECSFLISRAAPAPCGKVRRVGRRAAMPMWTGSVGWPPVLQSRLFLKSRPTCSGVAPSAISDGSLESN